MQVQPSVDPERPGRLARVQARVAEWSDTAVTRAEDARRRWVAVDAAFETHEHDRRAVGGVLAGAVAFRLFVYLLPLFLAVVAVLGILSSIKRNAPDDLGDHLGMSHYLIDSVDDTADESRSSLWILVPLTAWAIYSGGLGTAKVLHSIYAVAWGQPIERLRRGWLAALVTFGVAVLVGGSTAALQAIRQSSDGFGLTLLVVQLALLAGGWLGVSLLLPHDPAATWLDLLPGAVLVGVGVWLLHAVSVYFLAQKVSSASALYGSLGVAAALLAWLYILGRLLVGAAMLDATLWERRQRRRGDA